MNELAEDSYRWCGDRRRVTLGGQDHRDRDRPCVPCLVHASLGDHHRAVGLTSKCGGTDKYANVMIVLAPVRDGTGPSRLLAMLDGRSKKVFGDWLAERDQAWRDGIEVVAMDGVAGLKTATTEELPGAMSLMDPFHMVRLAGGPGMRTVAGCSRTCTVTAAARATRCTPRGGRCTPAPNCLSTASSSASTNCSRTSSTCRSRSPGASTDG